MYSIDRTTAMSFKLISYTYRHCVFTIPEELRPLFLKDRTLLNCLFSAVRSVVLRMFSMNNKQLADELRAKYIKNPPEGMTSSQVQQMSVDDLLDMHSFLTEEDFDDDEVGEEGFYIS